MWPSSPLTNNTHPILTNNNRTNRRSRRQTPNNPLRQLKRSPQVIHNQSMQHQPNHPSVAPSFLRKQEPKGGVGPGFPHSWGKCPKDKGGPPLRKAQGDAHKRSECAGDAHLGGNHQSKSKTTPPKHTHPA